MKSLNRIIHLFGSCSKAGLRFLRGSIEAEEKIINIYLQLAFK